MDLWSEALGRALVSDSPEEMKAALSHVPTDVMHLATPHIAALARTSLEQGNNDSALVCFDQLLGLTPDNPDWLVGRAKALIRLDRFTEGLEDINRLCGLRPEDGVAYCLKAQALEGAGDVRAALAACRQAAQLGMKEVEADIARLESAVEKQDLLERLTSAETSEAAPAIELAPPPTVQFDPLEVRQFDPAANEPTPMLQGLTQHLRRYGMFQAVRNAISRIEDSAWLDAWDTGLATLAGKRVLFQGSELGVLPLRAMSYGAASAVVAEAHPLESRIAAGIVQKNQLAAWHIEHGGALAEMTQEQRQSSFEAWAGAIRHVTPEETAQAAADADVLVVPAIDHTLLGNGIIATARRFFANAGAGASMLPSRARVFAMGIEWRYPASPYGLDELNRLRWSMYPETLEISDDGWAALTDPIEVQVIDFARFDETTLSLNLPVQSAGRLDAIVFWFELDIGDGRVSNAPLRDGGALRPAVQYVDPMTLSAGEQLTLDVAISESRIRFDTRPPATQTRSARLPSWYVPMLLDRNRNEAYRDALQRLLADAPSKTVLDIGAGCGLLSMLAADAGAERVVGCEISPAIHAVGEAVVRQNGKADRVSIVNKDCRQLTVPDDVPQRADLVLFEMFDCSLLGEGVLHYLQYVREHLATADARYLPMRARIVAQVVEYRLGQIWGQDVSLLNPFRFSAEFQNVDASELQYRALTEPFDVFEFEFATATVTAEDRPIALEACGEGTAGAVLFWFDLCTDGESWLSNAPTAPDGLHWNQGLQFLPEIEVEPGMRLPLLARHNGSALSFRWVDAEVPQKAFSRLPRFDPASWQQARELEMQTQQLMQHCLGNPDEYRKVAQLAMAFALDPAKYGLDGRIAQRFATSFLLG